MAFPAFSTLQKLWNPLSDLVPLAKANQAQAQEPADQLLARMAMVLSTEQAQLPTGVLKRFFSGEGLDFLHIREYQPGDDLRQLDWTVFARTGEPHVREYQDEHHLHVWFFLDLTAPMGFGQTHPKWAFARQLAAGLGHLAQQAGHRVGLVLWTGTEHPQIIPPHKDPAQWAHALHQALLLTPSLQPAQALPDTRALTAGRSVWFLLSDFGFCETLPQSEGWLHTLNQRHTVFNVVITDPTEEKLPKGCGPLPLAQGSGSFAQWVNLAHLPSRRHYQRRFAQGQAQRVNLLRRIAKTVVCSSQTPIFEALQRVIRGEKGRC